MSWKAIDRYSKDYIELQTKDKVRFYRTPDSILQAQLETYDAARAKKRADNPIFKEIEESQRVFAERAVQLGPRQQRQPRAWPTTTTSASRPAKNLSAQEGLAQTVATQVFV